MSPPCWWGSSRFGGHLRGTGLRRGRWTPQHDPARCTHDELSTIRVVVATAARPAPRYRPHGDDRSGDRPPTARCLGRVRQPVRASRRTSRARHPPAADRPHDARLARSCRAADRADREARGLRLRRDLAGRHVAAVVLVLDGPVETLSRASVSRRLAVSVLWAVVVGVGTLGWGLALGGDVGVEPAFPSSCPVSERRYCICAGVEHTDAHRTGICPTYLVGKFTFDGHPCR